jgi:hypothetical protein
VVSSSGTAAGVNEPAGLPLGAKGAGAFPLSPSPATARHKSTRSECQELKSPRSVSLSGISRKAAFQRTRPQPILQTHSRGKGSVIVTDRPGEYRSRVTGDSHVADFGYGGVFEAVLATKDPAQVQQAFARFHVARRQREGAHALAIRSHVAQVFARPRLPVPTHSPKLSEFGFNMDIVAAYSAFLRQRHDLLDNLIQLHRGETSLDHRPNDHLVVPNADFPNKERWVHIVNHGVIPAFHTPLPVQSTPPRNHKSWTEAFPLLIRDIAKGQLRGEYLILAGDLSPVAHAVETNFPLPIRWRSQGRQAADGVHVHRSRLVFSPESRHEPKRGHDEYSTGNRPRHR